MGIRFSASTKYILFSKVRSQAVGPTLPPTEWHSGALYLAIRLNMRKADTSV